MSKPSQIVRAVVGGIEVDVVRHVVFGRFFPVKSGAHQIVKLGKFIKIFTLQYPPFEGVTVFLIPLES